MKIYLFFILGLLTTDIFSQNITPLLKYSEIVTIEGASVEELNKRAKNWLMQNKFFDTDSSQLNLLKSENEFYVYQKGIASKKLHGKVTYSVLIELKENKFRYTFSNFIFHYYKQTRNYEMVPTKKQKPLEDEKAPGWQNLWEKHKENTHKYISVQIENLKKAMQNVSEKTPLEEKEEEF